MAAPLNDMQFAARWRDDYVMSPVAHPQVKELLQQFPPTPDHHEMYDRLMRNVADHHAQEWFKAGDKDEHHEPIYHATTNYRDAHNGLSGLPKGFL